MKKKLIAGFTAVIVLTSCHKDKEILDVLSDYNTSMERKGYHFGDELELPEEVKQNINAISMTLGNKETSDLIIDPAFFTLGDNKTVFNIQTKNGKTLSQEATINVFTKIPEKTISYQIVAEYPHDPENFVQGFQLEGNTVYESDGGKGESKLLKYMLGTTTPLAVTQQSENDFSEGCTIVGNKIIQLTWKSKKGFIYDKNSLKLLSEFKYPNELGEGWGLTYDGKNLIVSDGSKQLYFLEPDTPSRLIKTIAVAGNSRTYTQLNELEYHNGFIYANVWGKHVILKINPDNGEVVGKLDVRGIAKKNTKGENDVLNGIAFKGENMLITGKNWTKIYEIAIK
ncbi:glutaminyl-peptide cyclotransferase [Chryseobacterium sp. Alg-005]|uniref:glutaminyl-peptide cyclotransferase n=1 Tax=Chryseobacterium sp. Alg-005 TaxID=3159516 RepID=UPI0036F31489